MNLRTIGNRKRLEIICLGVLAGILPLSGCAFSRSVEDKFPAWMRLSQTPAAEVRSVPSQPPVPAIPKAGPVEAMIASNSVKDSYPPPSVSMRPQGHDLALSDVQSSAPQSPQLPARLIAETPLQANPWSSLPQASYPPLRLVSEDSVSPPAQPTTPRSPDPQLEVARPDPRPVGRPAVRTVVHASATTFDEQVLRSDAPVLVDFYASWCGPCKKLAPTLEEVAAESPQAKVVKVNIDESPELAARYGVKSIPSLMVFKDGQVVAKQKGVVSKTRLVAMLDL